MDVGDLEDLPEWRAQGSSSIVFGIAEWDTKSSSILYCVEAVLVSGAPPGQPAPGPTETSRLMHHRHPFLVRVLPNVSDIPKSMQQHVCLGCGKADGSKLLRCARYEVAYYCSKQCQVAHWGAHKSSCAPQSTSGKDVRKMATKLFREARDSEYMPRSAAYCRPSAC